MKWFSVVFLAAFLTTVSASPVPKPRKFSPAEKWVVEKVTGGEIADLTEKFADENDRKLSAQFLEHLLTGMLPGVKPHRNGVRILWATIDEPIDLTNAQIPWEVQLRHCKFGSDAIFANVSFARTMSFSDSTFKGTAQFISTNVGQAASFRRAVFEGKVSFQAADIGGSFSASDAQFKHPEEVAMFDGIKVRTIANFERTVFNGPVNFTAADIGTDFQAEGVQFTNKTETAWLSMKCGRKGSFKQASFAGPVYFADSNFLDLLVEGNNPTGATVSELDLSRSSIKRQLTITKIRVRDLIGRSLHVEGPADFTGLIVERSADLSDADFATLDLSTSVWPKDGNEGQIFRLRGVNYKYLCADATESESHSALLMLADQSAFSADIYGNLEAFFMRQGYSGDADRAFIARKQRERDESLHRKEYLSWLGSKLLDWLVGYGRHPSQAGYFCALFVALGFFLFAPEKMELQKTEATSRIYNRFWYSLGLFLPVVNLESDKVWKPKPNQTFLRNYMRVHMLLGWILIPILLAALTGLIK